TAGDLKVRPVRVDLLRAEVPAVALLDPAVEDLGRPLVVRLEEVLPKGVVRVPFPHQDAGQVRVPGEPDAHHVEDLALLEVRPRRAGRPRRRALSRRRTRR